MVHGVAEKAVSTKKSKTGSKKGQLAPEKDNAEKPQEQYLRELKTALGDTYNTMLVEQEDEILLRFLRFSNFDVPKAVRFVLKADKYLRKNEKELKIPYDDVKYVWRSKAVIIMKEPDHEGRKVILLKAANWDVNEFEVNDGMRALAYALDELLCSVDVQINGIALIVDFADTNLLQLARLVSQFKYKQIMQLIEIYQGGYPIRVRGIYTSQVPFLVSTTYNGVKYLLKKKMRDRIKVNYGGPEVLLEYFSKDFLPQSLLGNVPDDSIEDLDLLKRLRTRHKVTS